MNMTETIQIRRGLNSQRTSVVFAQGEPVWTTDTQAFYIGDGATPGGIFVASGVTGGGTGITYSFSGLGTVTVTTVGNLVYISGATSSGNFNVSGYITTGNADSRYYPLTGNPSGFINGNTGLFVATGSNGIITGYGFITQDQSSAISQGGSAYFSQGNLSIDPYGNLNTQGQVDALEFFGDGHGITNLNTGFLTGQFYPLKLNPSGFATTGYITGVSGVLQLQISSINNITGIFITTGQTGNFSSNTGILTGVFYPLNSNPSGYLTGISTGNFITNSQTGQFQPSGNYSLKSGNTSTTFSSALLESSNLGLNLIDRSGQVYFVCYGDSITAGVGSTPGASWPAVLQQAGFVQKGGRCFNMGLTTQTTAQGLRQYSGISYSFFPNSNPNVEFLGSFGNNSLTITGNITGYLTAIPTGFIIAASGIPLNTIVTGITTGISGVISINNPSNKSVSNGLIDIAKQVFDIYGAGPYVDGTLNTAHQLSPNFQGISGYFMDFYGANDYYDSVPGITGTGGNPITPFSSWTGYKQSLWAAAHNDGYKVIVFTLIPAGNSGTGLGQGNPGSQNNRNLLFNPWILTQSGGISGWDYCFDISSQFPQQIVTNDPLYFTDLLHPSASGEGIIGNYVNSQFFAEIQSPNCSYYPFSISGIPQLWLPNNIAYTNQFDIFTTGIQVGNIAINGTSFATIYGTQNIYGSLVGQGAAIINMAPAATYANSIINFYNSQFGTQVGAITSNANNGNLILQSSGQTLTLDSNDGGLVWNGTYFNVNGSAFIQLNALDAFRPYLQFNSNGNQVWCYRNNNGIIQIDPNNAGLPAISFTTNSGIANLCKIYENLLVNANITTNSLTGTIVKANSTGTLVPAIAGVDYPIGYFNYLTGYPISVAVGSGTSFASSSYSANPVTGIFPNTPTGPQWFTNITQTGFVGFQFNSPQVVTTYIVAPPYNNVTGRYPNTWTFQGSNDGVNYVILDTQNNYTRFVNGVANYFPIFNSSGYLYYRLNITANNGDAALGINELAFLGGTSGAIQSTVQELIIGNTGIISGNYNSSLVVLGSATITGTTNLNYNLNGIAKLSSGIVGTATAGIDYLAPSGKSIITITGTGYTGSTNTRYIGNTTGLLHFYMPSTANIGDTVNLIGVASGWTISVNSGQTIHQNSSVTSPVTGTVSSSNQYNCIEMTCVTSSGINWVVTNSQGTLIFV